MENIFMLKKKMLMVSALYSTFNLVSGMAIAGDLPSGGVVKSGDIDISQTSESLKVLQKTDKGIIEWQDFSVGRDKSVHFQQPSKTSATLNRVKGDFTSKIAGQITATGQVFLVNPNGILITKDGAINTHGFVASTLDITDDNFNKGNYTFSQESKTGLVENQGNIDVSDGGFVALLGGAVKNTGIVNAHLGKIGFAGGERIVLSFGGNDFLRVEIPVKDLSTIKDANGNPISDVLDINGTIKADGGMVQLTVATAAKLYRQGVSLGGYVQVNTAVRKNGVIKLNGGDVNLNKNAKIVANNGNVKIDTDSLTSSGSVQATQGNIDVTVAGDATLNKGASFDVSGNKAGKITFTAGTRKVSRFKSEADFKADSTKGTGGYIDITAKKGLVWLVSGNISAKGTTQGGRIRVGGAFQGGGYNAKTTQLDKKATDSFVNRWGDTSTLQSADDLKVENAVTINTTASAGSGGTVILWSDKATDNAGKIDARGVGQQGGSVEISGKKDLINAGLKQVHVNGGTLLLDPKNITFSTMTSPTVAGLKTQLEGGTSATIMASNDITVDVALDTTSDTGSSGKLTLIAGRSILINQDLKIKGGLDLKANSNGLPPGEASKRDTGTAVITVATGKTISGGDEDLKIKMLDGDRSAADNKKYSGRITVWKADGKRVSIVHNGTKFDSTNAASISEIKILKGGRITATDDGNGVGHVVIELKSKRFVNESDASAFYFKSLETFVYLGRLLVWTESPENNVMGGLQSYNFAQFNKSYNPNGGDFQSNTTKTSGTEKTSGFMYSTSLQVNYTASGASKTKIYNKTSTASTTNLALALKNADASSVATKKGITFKVGSLSGRADKKKHRDIKVTLDTSSVTGQYRSSDGSAEQKNAGSNLKVRYSGLKVTYRDANNRLILGIDTKIDDVSGASISKKEVLLEGSDFTASTRVYNGTNDTSVTVTVASGNGGGIMDNRSFGLEAGDQVQLDVTGAFKYADGNAGKKKRVYIADRDKIKFTGKDGGNYKLNNSLYKSGSGMPNSMKKGEITKKPLAIFAADFTVQTKTYDKTTDAKVTVASGNGKGIATTGNIGLVGDDKVTLDIQDGAFKFKNANAKNNEDVVFDDVSKITLTGADAKNYMLNPNYKTGSNTFGIVGTITKRELVLNKDEFQAVTRWYDGTTDATTKVGSRTKVVKLKTGGADGLKTATQAGGDKGVLSGDTVTFTIRDNMFKFNSKDADSADKLLVTTKANLNAGLGGKDAGNYEFKYSNNANSTIPAKITKKPLAIFASDFTVQTKTYDKTTDAKVTVASGNGKGFVTTGHIGLVSGEKVTLDIQDGAFKFKNANAKKDETIVFGDMSKITLAGADAKNYMLNPDYKTGFETYIVGTITKRELTLNKDDFQAVTKTYDGTTDTTTTIVKLKNDVDGLKTATEAGAGKGVVSGDTVTFTITKDMFKFNSKDVATANKLLITTKANLNAGLGGSSKANYEFKYSNDANSTISASITAKTITLNKDDFTVTSRVYVGASENGVVVTLKTGNGETGLTDSEIVGSDDVKVKLSSPVGVFEYADGNAGTSKTVKLKSAAGLTLDGTAKGNYKFDTSWHTDGGNTVLKGNITKRELTLKMADFKAVTKVYDGNTNTTTTIVALTTTGNNKGVKTAAEETSGSGKGVISGDNVTFTITGDMFKFDKKDASGTNRATKLLVADNSKLNAGLDNTSKANYEFKYSANADTGKSATITKRELTLKMADFKTVTKVYDGTTAAAKTTVVALTTTGNNKGVKTAAEETSGSNKGVVGSDNVTFTIASDMFKFDKTDVSGTNRATKLLVADNSKLNDGLDSTSKKNYEFKYSANADTGKAATITARTLNLNLADLEVDDRQYASGDVKAPVKVSSGKTGFADAAGNEGVVGSDDVKLNIAADAFKYADDTKGNGKQVKWHAKAKVTLSGAKAINYTLDLSSYSNNANAGSLTGNILGGTTLTITLSVNDKDYNGNTTLVIGNGGKGTISGWKAGETLSKTWDDVFKSGNNTATAVAKSKNAGKTVGVTFSGLVLKDAYKSYTIQYAVKTVEIRKKTITLNKDDFTVTSRVYKGANDKTVTVALKTGNGETGLTDSRIVTPAGGTKDTVKVKLDAATGVFEYADGGAADGKTLKLKDASKLTLDGADKDNYKFDVAWYKDGGNTVLTGNITKRELTLNASDFETVTKTYDGNTNITTTIVRLKTGNDKTGLTAANGDKGVVGGETLKLNVRANMFKFNSKDVANADKLLVTTAANLNAGLDGATKANYEFKYANNADSGIGATITKRELTLNASDFATVTKAYDGTTDITTAIVRLKTGNNETGLTAANGNKGVISGDTVKLVVAANMFKFNNKDVANADRLLVTTAATLNAGLDGASKDNYEFKYANNANSGISATITQKALTLNKEDYKVADKVYDNTTAAKVTVGNWKPWGLAGVVGNEDVKIEITDGAFVFATKDANVNKQVNFADVSKLKLIGAQSANYKFDTSIANGADSGLKGTITKRELTLKVSDFQIVTKAYDGTTDITTAIVRLKTGNNETGLTAANGNKGVISGDRVKLVIAANMFKFNSKDIASANRLLITTAANLNAGLDGASKDNYEFEYANNANSGISATITQKALTLNTEDYKVADKVYDDSTAAKVTVGDWKPWGLAGVVGNEDVKIEITDGAFVFATKDANVNKQVNFADVSKLKLIGAQSANYKFDTSIANGADSGLKGTISQIVSDEAVNIFKNVMKTNPLTGSAVFSARQKAFVPPTPVKSVFSEPSKPVAPTPSAVPSADASPDNTEKPVAKNPVAESPVAEKSEAQDADNSRESVNDKSQENPQDKPQEKSQDKSQDKPQGGGEDTKKTAAKKRSSGNFIVSLRSVVSGADNTKQLAKAYSEKIVNPDKDEEEGIVLILD